MKILWLINIQLPEVSNLMKENTTPFGGWLVSMSTTLSNENIELSISFPKVGVNHVVTLQGDNIKYYAFPPVNHNNLTLINQNQYFKEIIEKTNPDIVHIFGTEFAHTLAMVNICNSERKKVVISIQGLTSIIAKHYTLGLPGIVQKRYTFRDFIKQDNLIQQQHKFIKRGKDEIEALQKVNHVIGRTTWDKACTSQINPDAHYYHCNETLRDEFYRHTWDIKSCERYSIFVSQGSYPIKGLHLMLEAMPLILKKFPKAKLYIGGLDIYKSDTIKQRLKTSSYAKYIKAQIKNNKLADNIIFTGLLDEKQMCKRFLNSNVFVCPSSIENSPNSLGEAMILGVPCVASDVGGVSDMLKHKEEGFVYQADAPYMLAHYVCEIFKDDGLALKFSNHAKAHALQTHDPMSNNRRLNEIYEDILQKKG